MKVLNLSNKINLPNKTEWEDEFIKSKSFEIIKKIIIDVKKRKLSKFTTSRERYLHQDEILSSLSSFYFVNYIVENTKTYPIIDVGCGMNLFKNIYPIIGLDPVDTRADIKGIFNIDFVKKYRENFYSAIAINSLHFIPIWKIKNRIKLFSNIIKKDGLGYFTMNSKVLIQNTDKNFISKKKLYENNNLSEYIFNEIFELDNILELLHYEDHINTLNHFPNINGDIRIVFRKKMRTTLF